MKTCASRKSSTVVALPLGLAAGSDDEDDDLRFEQLASFTDEKFQVNESIGKEESESTRSPDLASDLQII